MANERIEVDIVLNDGSIKKSFVGIKDAGTKAGRETGQAIEGGLKSGVGNAISGLKTQLLGLGAAFAGFAAISKITGQLGELETAFAEIKTILPDVSQGTDELRQSLIDASAQFGTSPAEQAKSFYSIVSAGITDTAKAQEALTAANKLAIGGLTDTQTAIDIITSSVNAFGQENLSAARASDILFGAVRLGKTTVGELAGTLGQILPSAKALGVTFEDVAAATAALTTRGVSTGAAVTQLNAILTAVLKNQSVAKELGPQVAKSFSLQALQAKGLTGFLVDLNTSLGGSEAGLTKLLGRAEGARAILTLAGDGFNTLNSNVEALKNSAGAADAAFEIVNSTTAAQTNQILSKLTAVFAKITGSGQGVVFELARTLNQALASILANFDAIAAGFAFAIQKVISGLLALRIAPSLFAGIGLGVSKLATQFSLLPTRIALASLKIKQMSFSLKGLGTSLKTGVLSLKGYVIGLKTANIGMKILRATAKLTAASLTLGLSFAIDFLITKFIEISDAFGGVGNVLKFVVLTARKAFNDLILLVVDLLRKLEKIPFIGDKIAGSFGRSFDRMEGDALVSLANIEKGFDDLATKFAENTGIIPSIPVPTAPDVGGEAGSINVPSLPPVDEALLADNRAKIEASLAGTTKATKKSFSAQINIAEVAWSRIAGSIGIGSQNIAVTQAQLEATAVESFKKIGTAATEGFARSFSAIGEAIVNGEDAFAAFGKSILGVLGDVAIQAGTMYTLLGIASYNPAQIGAGIALTIVGGVLKALAGGGGSSAPSSGGGGGGLDSNPIDGNLSPIDGQTQLGQQVAINIQGDILDGDETGLRIADILKEQGFNNAVVSG